MHSFLAFFAAARCVARCTGLCSLRMRSRFSLGVLLFRVGLIPSGGFSRRRSERQPGLRIVAHRSSMPRTVRIKPPRDFLAPFGFQGNRLVRIRVRASGDRSCGGSAGRYRSRGRSGARPRQRLGRIGGGRLPVCRRTNPRGLKGWSCAASGASQNEQLSARSSKRAPQCVQIRITGPFCAAEIPVSELDYAITMRGNGARANLARVLCIRKRPIRAAARLGAGRESIASLRCAC